LPPPHKQHAAQHHPSITSLNRNSLTNRRNQSPAPPAALPAELQTTPESVQLQDSWVLGSNVPLESRHFLFKTGTGTTPLFSTATPGYTMASGSVYSPPTRPLPRNTLSRSAFKFKKSSKYCSWKCTALCAVGVSVLLAVLLSYFIGTLSENRAPVKLGKEVLLAHGCGFVNSSNMALVKVPPAYEPT
ncbi:Teneurin-3, partial [Myotis davidii]